MTPALSTTRVPQQAWRGSPNYNARPAGVLIDAITLHADASNDVASSISWCQTPAPKNPHPVSYHAIVGRTGILYGLVAPQNRAWHDGVSAFGGRHDVNNFSIGLCLSNNQRGEPFADAALEAAAFYCAEQMKIHEHITVERIHFHSECALHTSESARAAGDLSLVGKLGRKHDPGPLFPRVPFLLLVHQYLGR